MQGLKYILSKGRWQEAFTCYLSLRRSGLQLTDPSLFPAIIKACSQVSFAHGVSIHASSIKHGYEPFTSVENSVLDFYMKWGVLGSALLLFRGMRCRDSVSWNIMVHGFLDHGELEQGLGWFMQGRVAGFQPNVGTLVLIAQACCYLKDLDEGMRFHGFVIKAGFWGVVSLQNSLLGMYCDVDMESARVLFDEMFERDMISWSVMIEGYVQNEEAVLALELFQEMVSEAGVQPDGQAMVSVLKACTDVGEYGLGRCIHGAIICKGFDCDVFTGNSLISMYMKTYDANSASIVFNDMPFRNNISWNSMLSAFVHNGMHSDAQAVFSSMVREEVPCDEVTLVNLLQICKHFVLPYKCKSIHTKVLRSGYELNDVLLNSLFDAYAKCYLIKSAEKLFSMLTKRDIVSWGAMIGGFAHCGLAHESVSAFREMSQSGVMPNEVVILNLIEACASLAELGRAKWVHGIAIRRELAAEVSVGTAIVDMYSKCGAVETSRKALEQLHHKNIQSWSTMIAAYGMNGRAHEAFALLTEMKRQGLEPNAVTAVSILSACSHAGLVAEGLSFFQEIVQDGGIQIGLEHYACVIDMLSRAGKIDDAMHLIETMPDSLKTAGASLWGALLSSCSRSGDSDIGAEAVSRVLELEPSNSAGYMLASNMHGVGGTWADAAKMRLLVKQRGVKVVPGRSWLHIDNEEFSFVAGDGCSPLSALSRIVVEKLHRCLRMGEDEH
ncbi:hypothetical protein Droror1_Dr00006902 [Drosera rotundifolia]